MKTNFILVKKSLLTTLIAFSFTSVKAQTYITPAIKWTYLNSISGTRFQKDAEVNNKAVLLKWVTVQEMNNGHYEVERSFDMDHFSTIGVVLHSVEVNGKDNSYNFIDDLPFMKDISIIYYRLKQIDLNGEATFSKALVIRLQPESNVDLQVSPNPFAEYLTVKFKVIENCLAKIRINNIEGQTVRSKQFVFNKGFYNIQIAALDNLSEGLYVVQLIVNGVIIKNQKIIKNKYPIQG